ncbi:MAG TPA: Mrp/NBP35 family ATP-binding protein [Bacteroidales bacterium]
MKDKIEEALRNVNHPAKGTDIVSAQVLQNIEIVGNKIILIMNYGKANDPFANSIKKSVVKILEPVVGSQYIVEFAEVNNRKPLLPEYYTLKEVKNIIAVSSGKGGVGKSTVASNLAIALSHTGAKVALLDADVYGPSAPKMFGEENFRPVMIEKDGKEYIESLQKYNIKVQSIGFFVSPGEATIWRGPMASNALKQVITQTWWGELDFLVLDMPPGTGDIHLTIVQELPVTGVIVVSTPQNVALADAIKGISMFRSDKINVPVLGLVENMAWFTPAELPDNKYYIFGKDGCKKLAESLEVPLLGQIPIVQSICEDGDNGTPSAMNPFTPQGKAFAELAEAVIAQVEIRNKTLPPTKKVEVTQK